MSINIEYIKVEDAKGFGKFLKTIDSETKTLLWEPGERSVDKEYQRKRIESINEDKQMVLVAKDDDKIVGFLSALVGSVNRLSHRVDFTMGVLPSHQDKKIGSKLLDELESWAKKKDLSRIELTVMAHNSAAIQLYKKYEYLEEGRKIGSIKLDGDLIDEIVMGKSLK